MPFENLIRKVIVEIYVQAHNINRCTFIDQCTCLQKNVEVKVQPIQTASIREKIYYKIISEGDFRSCYYYRETMNICSCLFVHSSCCSVLGTSRISPPEMRSHTIFIFVYQG